MNDQIISPSTVYLISVLDPMKYIFIGFSVMIGLSLVFNIFKYKKTILDVLMILSRSKSIEFCRKYVNREDSKEMASESDEKIKKLSFSFLIFMVISLLIPSKEVVTLMILSNDLTYTRLHSMDKDYTIKEKMLYDINKFTKLVPPSNF